MRISVGLAATLALAAEAAVIKRDYAPAFTDQDDPRYGVMVGPAPGPNKPQMQWEPAKHNQQHGAKRVKVRYGPYLIPGVMEGDLGKQMEKEGGIVWNMADLDVKKPCEDCMLTFFQSGLEDQAGNDFNTDNGVWLHHMVAIMEGPTRWDPTCVHNSKSLPHVAVLSDANHSERFWASGNERTPADFTKNRDGAAYRIYPEDKMHFVIDLMNLNMEKKLAYMTFTWEFVPSNTPGFKNTKPIWLDSDQCGMSDIEPKNDKAFALEGVKYKANFEGWMGGMAGHLHDGGLNIEVLHNDKNVCNSTALYGETAQYRSPPVKTMDAKMDAFMNEDRVHISTMNLCYNVGQLKLGDTLDTTATYDYALHPGMRNDEGGLSGVMNIVIIYTVVDSDPPLPPAPALAASP